jgi:type I restriction enzyme R subunit
MGEDARAILEKLLDKYAERGVEEFDIPNTFKANLEFQQYGNVAELLNGSVEFNNLEKQ